MTSTSELFRQLEDPTLTADQRAVLRCRLAKQLIDNGNFTLARESLGELWLGVGEIPDIEELNATTAAEIILRIGVLSAWIGSSQQIRDSQEMAKNLISESIRRFEALGRTKKVAEAQMELGCCYWREGAFNEARDILKEALYKLSDVDEEIKAKTLLRLSLVESSSYRLVDSLILLSQAVPLFEKIDNHYLKGHFHGEFGLVLRRLMETERRDHYIDRALIEYAAASYHFEQAGNSRYQACVENNLGFLFSTIGKYEDAHQHLDRAQTLLTQLRDAVHLSQVDETRARVLLAEGKPGEAERVVRNAVVVFERGGEQALLAEALTTHGIALARLEHVKRARLVLQRAIEVAERAGDREGAGRAALAVCEELFAYLEPDDLLVSYERADELLKDSPHPVNQRRLLDCTRRLLFRFGGIGDPLTWEGVMLVRFLSEFEARLVERALRASGGVITRAAQLLGIKRQRLSNMLHTRHRRLLSVLTPAEVEVAKADAEALHESDADDAA